jgi:hypothetical protein
MLPRSPTQTSCGARTETTVDAAPRFLGSASTLLGVSPVSSLTRLDTLLSSSAAALQGHAVRDAAADWKSCVAGAHLCCASSICWHLRLSVEFLHAGCCASARSVIRQDAVRARAPVVLDGVVGSGRRKCHARQLWWFGAGRPAGDRPALQRARDDCPLVSVLLVCLWAKQRRQRRARAREAPHLGRARHSPARSWRPPPR